MKRILLAVTAAAAVACSDAFKPTTENVLGDYNLRTFETTDTSGTMTGRDDFAAAPALLVAFLCNHCPYVRHVETALGGWQRPPI